ncbi:hypothetical protein BDA99DRAFT_573400 [Phascolomyces articulosus]|uniref:Uncharacterized protein n=1 Tax=Phascolomyces articulosus TaxID=60185 RepID=A0AAD5K6D3_9FUNG|nr:hypothetical protein BDA99DRAFT_573400 [Phascolomyces articulosus]
MLKSHIKFTCEKTRFSQFGRILAEFGRKQNIFIVTSGVFSNILAHTNGTQEATNTNNQQEQVNHRIERIENLLALIDPKIDRLADALETGGSSIYIRVDDGSDEHPEERQRESNKETNYSDDVLPCWRNINTTHLGKFNSAYGRTRIQHDNITLLREPHLPLKQCHKNWIGKYLPMGRIEEDVDGYDSQSVISATSMSRPAIDNVLHEITNDWIC